MLYLIHGSDYKKAFAKKNELLSVMLRKRPGAEVFALDAESFREDALKSLYSSQGLFEQKHIVVLDKIFARKEVKDFVLGALSEMEKSQSVFILLEDALDAKTAASIEKHSAKTFSFGEKKKKEWTESTNFLIADAFAAKDRRSAWVLFQKAILGGASAEEIHGTLFWQAKVILLAKKTKSAEEAGLKPYVFGKASRFAKNFTESELQDILSLLVKMYHDIRLDGGELVVELEKFLLRG